MKTIIMAGGEGSRLRPLTCDRPKPMVPVMGKPIMEHIIYLLKQHNLSDIGVTLMYLPEDIKDYFGDGSSFDVSMRYFVEETPLGTAGSVKNGQKFLDQPFLVISGDALTDFNLSEIIRFHREKKAAVTIVLTRVENPLEYGVVITDQENRIKQFLEKPSWGEVFSDTVNTGIYVIEPEILEMIPQNTKYDFSKDLFPRLLEKGYPMFGCIMPGYWCDIGNLTQYRNAHYDVLAGRARTFIPGQKKADRVWVGKGAEIHPEAHLEGPLFIGENARIGKGVCIGANSVIGANCILEEGVSVKRSIVWDNVYIGKKGTLRGATVCNRVKMKSQAAVYEGAVVGDDTILNNCAVVKPEVKIWPAKTVDKGTILNESLVWGSKVSKHLFGTNGICGKINIEIMPEVAVKLGASYGTCLKKRGQVAVGSDGYGCSQMIKEAFSVGLISAGCHVLDLGQSVTPLTRYGIKTLGVNGGIQVISLNRGERVQISFFNEKGGNILKDEERKIENTFLREDYRRVSGSQVAVSRQFPDLLDSYYKEIIKNVDQEQIIQRRPKVFLEYDRLQLGDFLPRILKDLGCQVFVPEEKNGLTEGFQAQIQKVHDHRCDLGAIFSSDWEHLTLIDNLGRVIHEDLFTALVSLLVLKNNDSCTLVVPVTASTIIDKLADRYNGRVIRTKTGRQFILEQVLNEGVLSTQNKYKQYRLQFDPINALVQILDYLTQEQLTMAELIDTVPDFYMTRKEIDCPWSAKGTVMRRLIEEQNQKTDLLDGVKIFHPNGWALVLPDSDEPVCRIFSEGTSMEIAEELTAIYAEKVNNFKKM